MKKVLVCGMLLLLGACSGDISQYSTADSNASIKTRMRACLVSEATSKFQAGTLFVHGISETSDELVGICLKKLALQAAGVSEESQSTAQSIIQSFKGLGVVN